MEKPVPQAHHKPKLSITNEVECLKKAKKVKNGYTEREFNMENKSNKRDYLEEWKGIVNAKDLHKALVEHFSYLADTPGFEKVLYSDAGSG